MKVYAQVAPVHGLGPVGLIEASGIDNLPTEFAGITLTNNVRCSDTASGANDPPGETICVSLMLDQFIYRGCLVVLC